MTPSAVFKPKFEYCYATDGEGHGSQNEQVFVSGNAMYLQVLIMGEHARWTYYICYPWFYTMISIV